MGEAKQKLSRIAAIATKSMSVEVLDLERWYVLIHLRSGGYAPEGHEAAMNLSELVDALEMSDVYRMMLSSDPEIAEVQNALLRGNGSSVVELRSAIVNFFLETVTKGKMLADVSMALTPLIQRLKDAKSGAYTAPTEAAETAEPVDENATEAVA